MDTTAGEALLLIHQGSVTVRRLATACRTNGIEPVVVSDAPPDAPTRSQFEAVCRELNLEHRIVDTVALRYDDVRELVEGRRVPFAFAMGIWDGQRGLMARLNAALGAPDLSPAAVDVVQDKLAFRRTLVAHGLSALWSMPAADFLSRPPDRRPPGPWIVKPRRGLGSVCTRRADRPEQVRELAAVFDAGTDAADRFAEVYIGNELIVEEYFDGHEFSLELMMSDGHCLFDCEHEKTQMTFTSEAILENSFASPAVALDRATIEAALRLTLDAMAQLELRHGWFHVELRANAAGRVEFVEINPRTGGGLITESMLRQSGRFASGDWVRLLLRREVAPGTPRRCGTFQQYVYPKKATPIASMRHVPGVPKPDVSTELRKVGDSCRLDREDILAFALWETALDRHAEQVRELARTDFIEATHM